MKSPIKNGFLIIVFPFLFACSAGTAKHHFLQGEKFWFEKKYAPAVSEFEKTAEKDPKGKLGLYARFRSAEIRWLYLFQDIEAVQSFKQFLKESTDPDLTLEASMQMGEILFSRLQAYEQAYSHYKEMLKRYPNAKEAPEIQMRMAKCQFFLWNFDEAKELYDEIVEKYPASYWAEKATYESAASSWIGAERMATEDPAEAKEMFLEAKKEFQNFLSLYPKSTFAPHARFGIASIHESNEEESAAIQTLETLVSDYPSRGVVLLKLARIKGRQKKRGFSAADQGPKESKNQQRP